MKRIATIAALIMFAAAPPPAVAQWAGMPVWNNPKGGTGVTVDGDLGFPNSAGKSGTAFGARATLGLANISFTAGVSSWKPSGYSQSLTSVGGTAQFKVIGGSLIPVALNFQLGAGTTSSVDTGTVTLVPKVTTLLAVAGYGVNVHTPGINIEPYLSISNRWNKPSGGNTQSNVGWVIGVNIGIGAHVALKAPIGM